MKHIIVLIVFGSLLYSGNAQTVFTENFEQPSMQGIIARWNEARNADGMSLSSDVPPGSPGTQSLMMTSVIGENTGGHLYKMFPTGFDSLYARFYVKFGTSHNPVHHFVHIGGYNPPTRWPQGGAGERPLGNERFTSGIEPFGDRWKWDFYSYWMHMRGNPVPNRYWGNDFNPEPSAPVIRGKWTCIEVMMKCNNPADAYNGEQAFWIDGKQVLHLKQGSPNGYWVWDSFHHHPDSAGFEGFQWRNDPNLKINFFWLLYYMTQGPAGQRDTVWFDDVVLSNEYIGPHQTSTQLKELPTTESFSLTAYPNPFTDYITIQWKDVSQPSRLQIFDTYGRLVKEFVLNEQHSSIQWKPKDLLQGMYYVRLLTQKGAIIYPVIALR